MSQHPQFGFEQLVGELLRGVIEAVAERPGATEAQCFARYQTTMFSVMALQPRDALEIMVAGHCVLFDALLREATRDLLHQQAERIRLRIRSQAIALGRTFLKHLAELRQLQARPNQQVVPPNQPPPAAADHHPVPSGSAAADPRHAAARPEPPTAEVAGQPDPTPGMAVAASGIAGAAAAVPAGHGVAEPAPAEVDGVAAPVPTGNGVAGNPTSVGRGTYAGTPDADAQYAGSVARASGAAAPPVPSLNRQMRRALQFNRSAPRCNGKPPGAADPPADSGRQR